MSTKEIARLELIQRIENRTLSQKEAAEELELSSRHMKRLVRAYRQKGVNGLVSKSRGQISNNAFSSGFKAKIKALVTKYYADFGPSFAAEKLEERDRIKVSRETLRQWMIGWGFWTPKRSKKIRVHQQRPRRPCFGELVQIDGSPHAWFEERGEECCLIVFIDDATSRICELLFVPVESTKAYLECIKHYIQKYGRPIAFYSDRHSIFRINQPCHLGNEKGETQLGRALKELGIQIICANSAQAKGRVERANRTLQDRLVKEMRLRGISNIEEGNRYLKEFKEEHNRRFAEVPASDIDQHRQTLPSSKELDFILCEHFTRQLSKNLELSFDKKIYQIITKPGQVGYRMRGAKVTVAKHLDGKISIWYRGKKLAHRLFKKTMQPAEIVNSKEINPKIKSIMERASRKPSIDHPWRIPFLSKASAKQR